MPRRSKAAAKKEMPRRGYWRGVISFGLINIAVQLIPAYRPGNDLHFHLLDKKDNGPIGYRRINKISGKEVPSDRIVKGYEYEPHKFVIVTDDDFERANPKTSRSIEIHDFVSMDELDILYIQRPYFLWPDKNGEKGYVLLRQALQASQKIAVAEIVLQKKQHLCVLIPRENYFILELLYYSHELSEINTDDLEDHLKDVEVSPRELKMAQTLIEGMTAKWNPKKYHDTYYEDVMNRISLKARKGQLAEVPEAEEAVKPTPNIVDLMPLLEKSLKAAQKSKQHRRA